MAAKLGIARPARLLRVVQAPLALASVLVTLAALGTWLWFEKVRYFDKDEFEHLHFAWCISRGMVPYRDFFEHHAPWFHFVLAALVPFFQVDRRFDDTLGFICLARRLDLLLAAAALALTFMLARLWRGSRSGWIAIAFLATTPAFARKTFEIRPDVLALVLWLGCLVALVRALSGELVSVRRRAMLFALSGALLGGAIMSTQKLLMVMPAFTLAMIWYVAAGAGEARTRMREVGLQFAGFAAPVLATLAYFRSRSALGAFIHFNLFLNLDWKTHEPPYRLLDKEFVENPVLLVFGGLGLIWEGFREFRQRAFSAGKLLLLSTAGLFAGLWEMPIAREQYYLTFLPLLAIPAGAAMAAVSGAVGGGYPKWGFNGLRYLIAAAFLSVAIIALLIAQGPPWLEAGVVVLLAVGAGLMIKSWTEAGLAVVLCALCLAPYYMAREVFLVDNADLLKPLRYVIEKTAPTGTIMDGCTGIGVFRPHAYFYWFLHSEIIAMITDEQRDQLLTDLQTGKLAPRYIVLGDWLSNISHGVEEFFFYNYQPVPSGPPKLWERETPAR